MDWDALVFPTGSLPKPIVEAESWTAASPPLPEKATV
jgi:hypothetical protein